MKYSDLIKKFEAYADEEVSMVASHGDVVFFPVSDGDAEIVHLVQEDEEPYKAVEVEG